MKEGHPYLTAALDAKRADQRLKLRCIPSWVFTAGKYAPGPRVTINGASDNAYVETLVRRLADEHLEALSGVFPQWEEETADEQLGSFFRDFVNADGVPRQLEAAAHSLFDEIGNRLNAVTTPRTIADEFRAPLARTILLLSWADDLADDGYIDARFAAQRDT
jgi:hypothetical protein